jgi:hypothetical protein
MFPELSRFLVEFLCGTVTWVVDASARWPWLGVAAGWGEHVYRWFRGIRAPSPPPYRALVYLDPESRVYTERRLPLTGDETVTAVAPSLYVDIPSDRHAVYRLVSHFASISLPASPPVFYRSPTKFLAVEYAHPLCQHPLSLTCPANAYFVDNELFSPLFVQRALLHTYGKFVPFDHRYTLHLVDHKLTYLSINSHECIVLTDDGYYVKDI